MINEDTIFITLTILFFLLLTFGIFFGILALVNYSVVKDCNMISEQGYETKIVKPFIEKVCLIKINDKFLPLENYRGFDEDNN